MVAANRLTKSCCAHTLNHLDATTFQHRLKEDAVGLCYSSIVSLTSALQDAQRNCGSWAVVKGYYACFYAMRSYLAANGIGIAYVNTTPIEIDARPGQLLKKRKGHTHEVVYNSFKDHYSSDSIVVNNIEGDEPILWLRGKRELLNYRVQRFVDPHNADGIARVPDAGAFRRQIEAYLADAFYAYDPDHASIALPIACVLKARRRLSSERVFKTLKQQQFVKELCRGHGGTMAGLYEKLCLQSDVDLRSAVS